MSALKDLIENEYHNPKNGYNLRKIYQNLKPSNPKLTQQFINTIINQQESDQLFKQKKSNSDFNIVIPKVPFARCQMDLLDLSNLVSNRNQGMKWLFVLVDSYTKLSFARPMKKKETKDCLEAFKTINEDVWEQFQELIQTVDCDNESAFLSKPFQKYCIDSDITLHFSRAGDSKSKAFIERFNRYLREKINKSMIARDSNNWTDVIQDIISAYNNTKHTTTKTPPVDAINDNHVMDAKIDENRERKRTQKKTLPQIGDKVRVLKQKNIYTKGTDARWSKDIHTVERIESGNRYFVSGRESHYKDYELLPVSEVKVKPKVDESETDELRRKEVRKEASLNKRDRKIKRVLNKESINPELEVKDENSRVLRKFKIKERDFGPYLQG